MHIIEVTWAPWFLKSPANRIFVHHSVHANNKTTPPPFFFLGKSTWDEWTRYTEDSIEVLRKAFRCHDYRFWFFIRARYGVYILSWNGDQRPTFLIIVVYNLAYCIVLVNDNTDKWTAPIYNLPMCNLHGTFATSLNVQIFSFAVASKPAYWI